MENEDLNKFSWISFFLVTSFCFFTFAIAMKVLEGVETRIFVWTASIAFILGIFNLLSGESQSTKAGN